jgi:hypothetical protein
MVNNETTHLNLYNHTERIHALTRNEIIAEGSYGTAKNSQKHTFNKLIIKVIRMLVDHEGFEDDDSPTTRTKPSRT